MKNYKYAVTHPGTAHADDTLTAALLLAIGIPVYRREPAQEELESPDIIVFDIGGKFQPEKGNYDHHQSADLPCAFLLVAEHVFRWNMQEAKEIFPWIEALDIQDRTGVRNMLQHFGCNPDAASYLQNPLNSGIIRLFGQEEKLSVHPSIYNPLAEILAEIGKGILSNYEQYGQDKEELQEKVISGETVLWTDKKRNSALFSEAAKREIRIVISPNIRGTGFSVTRVNDAKGVDFRNAKSIPGVTFVHNNGFLAVCDDLQVINKAIEKATK